MPWRVALALQADGWILRSDVIWAKPNPMPSSVTDRPTGAHEYVFMLAKRARYYFDGEPLRTSSDGDHPRNVAPRYQAPGQSEQTGLRRGLKRRTVRDGVDTNGGGQGEGAIGYLDSANAKTVWWIEPDADEDDETPVPDGGEVWSVPTAPFPKAHFATYPAELVRRIIVAGVPREVCRACGAPRERLVEGIAPDGRRAIFRNGKAYGADGKPLMGDNMMDPGVRGSFNSGGQTLARRTVGWSSCSCVGADGEHPGYRAGVVLDPFFGSGTTGMVARRLGVHAVGVELSAAYIRDLVPRRLAQAFRSSDVQRSIDQLVEVGQQSLL